MARLQDEDHQRTGIPSLKIGFNGYHLEVTETHFASPCNLRRYSARDPPGLEPQRF